MGSAKAFFAPLGLPRGYLVEEPSLRGDLDLRSG
jgi:hypothetical protein